MALSLLLLRRLSHLHYTIIPKPQLFSSIPSTDPDPLPKPTSLSTRMSFVFDQIDAIEQQRSLAQQDSTLQRIRTWRQSKNLKPTAADPDQVPAPTESIPNVVEANEEMGPVESTPKSAATVVELVHPWPEWIELMERLVQQNYFDHRRKDEDKLVEDLGFEMPKEVRKVGHDFTKDWKTIQTACLNFGKDRFDILRSLSRQDIQVLVGYGCPSADRRIVFSSKLLRKSVHLDEGDVCSSCNLRRSCEKAYLTTNKEDEATTIDVMRVLLTYGFNPLNGSVVNEALLKKKSVKTVVRKLLHEVVKLSAVPIDPNLRPPVMKVRPPKEKKPPTPPKKRVGRDDVEMKRGDWLCPKCNFLNFAKNTVCLQCDAKRPKRQLLPGEWECPQCDFLNYRRNMACFHCECKRPPDEFTKTQMEERQHSDPRMRSLKVPSRTNFSDAWNLDFDDNESDGADVAAFEYADSKRLDGDFPHGRQGDEETIRGAEAGLHENSRPIRPQEREYSARGLNKPGMGFDDFDDEEDDIESYELESHSGNQAQKSSSIPFSDLDVNSDSDDTEAPSDNWNARPPRVNSPRNSKVSKPFGRKPAFSAGSEDDESDIDSDEKLPAHRNWKSTHVADPRMRTRRGGINHGSDEDPGLSSGAEDDFPSRPNKGKDWCSSRRRGGNFEDESSNFESEDEGGRFSSDRSRGSKGGRPGPVRRSNLSRRGGNFEDGSSNFEFEGEGGRFSSDRSRGSKGGGRPGPGRRSNPSTSRGGLSFREDSGPTSRGMKGDRRNSFKGPPGRSQGDSDGRRRNAREDDSRKFRSPRQGKFGNKQGGRFNDSRGSSATDSSYFTEERYTRPRVNVR